MSGLEDPLIYDEIHKFKNADAVELWKRAIAKMPGDSLILLGTNTAASRMMLPEKNSDE